MFGYLGFVTDVSGAGYIEAVGNRFGRGGWYA